tara:strand:+ start:149 stop:595 length:447 start_codon:yes stop_codon:yes gene_type:complete
MTRIIFVLFIGFIAACQGVRSMTDTGQSNWFHEQKWKHRMVVISGEADMVIRQRDLFLQLDGDVLDRDLLVLTIIHPPESNGIDQSLPDQAEIQRHFKIETSEFQVLLVGKDGRVKERRRELVEPADFFDCIDAMPMRQDEVRIRRKG